MTGLFEEWIKDFDPMTNPKGKTLAEIRKEAFEAGFKACATYYMIEEEV